MLGQARFTWTLVDRERDLMAVSEISSIIYDIR